MTDDIKNAPISELLEVANDVVDQITSRSRIFDATSEAALPRFEERGKWNRGCAVEYCL
jgi:hypothetical protein